MTQDDLTSIHSRRARGGDRDSLEWIVVRFTPLLLAQARFRIGQLGPRLARGVDPEDVVSEVWMITLPRLGDLESREGRLAPVLLKFLATTLLFRVKNHAHRAARRAECGESLDGGPSESRPLEGIARDIADSLSRLIRREAGDAVCAALDELDDDDRRLIVLRGVEQVSNRDAAIALGLAPNTAAVRYRRALEKLRRRLPHSVFGEISDA